MAEIPVKIVEPAIPEIPAQSVVEEEPIPVMQEEKPVARRRKKVESAEEIVQPDENRQDVLFAPEQMIRYYAALDQGIFPKLRR
ncbi:MAG: hypothetical protein J6R23_01925 [Spirochaetales bacterium]|nr:hypothetical protein [Spirochaetales bacterium]